MCAGEVKNTENAEISWGSNKHERSCFQGTGREYVLTSKLSGAWEVRWKVVTSFLKGVTQK